MNTHTVAYSFSACAALWIRFQRAKRQNHAGVRTILSTTTCTRERETALVKHIQNHATVFSCPLVRCSSGEFCRISFLPLCQQKTYRSLPYLPPALLSRSVYMIRRVLQESSRSQRSPSSCRRLLGSFLPRIEL